MTQELARPETPQDTDIVPAHFSSGYDMGVYSNEESFDDSPSSIRGLYLTIAQDNSPPVKGDKRDSAGNSWRGQFYASGDLGLGEDVEFNNPLELITVVPIAGAAKQQLWSERPDSRVVCSAVGRKFSELVGTGMPGGPCKDCSLAKWVDRKPPPCPQVYSFVVYVVEWQLIAMWDLTRSTAQVGRAINEWVFDRARWPSGNGYEKMAFQVWADETDGPKYIKSKDQILLDEKTIIDPNRRRGGELTWYVPEVNVLTGTLEENDIRLPTMRGAEEPEDPPEPAPPAPLPDPVQRAVAKRPQSPARPSPRSTAPKPAGTSVAPTDVIKTPELPF